MMGKILAGVALMATFGLSGASALAADKVEPPQGARAVVQVSPNPTTRSGQEITITGDCGGGKRLKQVLSGYGKPVLEDVRILDDNPKGFTAKARIAKRVGNGVGPVFVDCDGEAGVVLLVTHV
ncbi:hypothetical protein ACIBHX_30555 [Nonomuraea sp. NPDC050536]|uniref:hypothetical protein n=1 Tax=Nonomuraea sp. NPDC050536 TaxID=3364366 RepID=UPI0037CC1921